MYSATVTVAASFTKVQEQSGMKWENRNIFHLSKKRHTKTSECTYKQIYEHTINAYYMIVIQTKGEMSPVSLVFKQGVFLH